MRSSIFSQIWIPLTALTLAAVMLLVVYYPTEQRKLFQEYKSTELQTIARTIATEVEHALDQDDFSGLNKMMSTLSDSSYLDCSALVFVSEEGEEELSAVFPEDYPLDINHIDTTQTIIIKSGFSSKIGEGYILIGLARAKLDSDIDKLNKPIFISFFFFASLIILVIYIIARSISRPILSLTEFALQLQRGQYKTFIDTKKPSSVELLSLNRSLNDLAVVLQSQQDSNEQLTENLEQQVKQKTENLQLAFNDLNTAQEIAQFANFSYDTENDTYKGSENLTKLLGIEAGGSNAFRPLLKCLKAEDIQEIEKQLRIAILN